MAEDENNGGRLVLRMPKPKPGIFAAVKKSASRLTGRRRMRVVRNVVLEVPPDLLLVKILETLSSLPPETFAALSQETAKVRARCARVVCCGALCVVRCALCVRACEYSHPMRAN